MKPAVSKDKFREIDIVRGITIFLVVCSHVGMPDGVNSVLTNIRMPLFFMVSGYLLSSRYLTDFKSLIDKRINSLIIPYFSACILFFVLSFPLSYLKGDTYNWSEALLAVLYGNGDGLALINATPLWFLVTLFGAVVIFAVILKNIQKLSDILQFAIFLLVGLVGFFIGKLYELPWGIDISMVATLFLFVGYKLKEKKFLSKLKIFDFMSLVAIVIFITTYSINLTVDMNHRNYNNIILFYIGGIMGAILVFKLSKLLSKNDRITNIFSMMGENSLLILLFHSYSAIVIGIGLQILSIQTSFNWFIIASGSIIISILVGKIVKRIPILNFLFNGKPMSVTSHRVNKVLAK